MTTFTAGLAGVRRTLAKAMPGGEGALLKATSAAAARSTAAGATMDSELFLHKALAASRAGRLSSAEVCEIESAIAHGRQPRAELVKAVLLETPVGLRGDHDAAFAKLQANLGISGAPMAKAERIDMSAEAAKPGRLVPSERSKVGGMPDDQFLIRAMGAQRKKFISATDVAEIEACVNAGKQPPARLVRAVMNGEEA